MQGKKLLLASVDPPPEVDGAWAQPASSATPLATAIADTIAFRAVFFTFSPPQELQGAARVHARAPR